MLVADIVRRAFQVNVDPAAAFEAVGFGEDGVVERAGWRGGAERRWGLKRPSAGARL
jgi:hypothetical protein